MKDVLVLPLPVGPRTLSLSMDLYIHEEDRRSATDQKILTFIFMATKFIQLSQNRHRYNWPASGGVYSNGIIERQHKVDHYDKYYPYYTERINIIIFYKIYIFIS